MPPPARGSARAGLLAVLVLTLGTAVAVATEFSLTALERSQVDGHAAQAGDRRARAVQRSWLVCAVPLAVRSWRATSRMRKASRSPRSAQYLVWCGP